jgi:signal transduction histidine kinase
VTVEVRDGDRPHVVRGDADLIGRALGNIVANALDALEGAAGRRLRISLATEPAGEGMAPAFEEIEVHDSGPGFAKDIEARAFEPYITTRAATGGTGLGLPLVERIVREHGGSVAAGTAVEGGAFVIMQLPIAGPSTAPGARAVAADEPGRRLRSA